MRGHRQHHHRKHPFLSAILHAFAVVVVVVIWLKRARAGKTHWALTLVRDDGDVDSDGDGDGKKRDGFWKTLTQAYGNVSFFFLPVFKIQMRSGFASPFYEISFCFLFVLPSSMPPCLTCACVRERQRWNSARRWTGVGTLNRLFQKFKKLFKSICLLIKNGIPMLYQSYCGFLGRNGGQATRRKIAWK